MVDLNEIHDSMYDNVRGYPLGISLFCDEAPNVTNAQYRHGSG